jgi:translin
VAQLDDIGERARTELETLHRAREDAYAASRLVIRAAANAIRAVHRSEGATARTLLDEATESLDVVRRASRERPQLTGAGFVLDAQKEYAEARLVYGLLVAASDDLPGPAELDIDTAAWLNGLAETVGELRRRMLDLLRAGDHDGASAALTAMEDIIGVLVTIDFPDGVTAGLRRSTDVARSITERSRGDLTTALQLDRVHRALAAADVERQIGTADG